MARVRAGTVMVARGEFNIVIAGLAAAAEPRLGALSAANVLIMAVAGPVVARLAEPTVRLLRRAPTRPAVAAR